MADKYNELFEPYKEILEAQGIKWSDDKIREFIKQKVGQEEASVSSKTTSDDTTDTTFGGQVMERLGVQGKANASDQNWLMDALGNTLWGLTEGGSWGVATGMNLATGEKISKAVSLGYSDPWAEESFSGKAGYILGSSLGALAGFILSGGTLARAGAAKKIGAEALAKLGGSALQKSGVNVANKILAKKLYETTQKKVGDEFFEKIVGTAANDVMKIGKGWWWNNTLRKQTLTMANRPISRKMKRAIARQELTDEGVATLEKTIFKDLAKKGLTTDLARAQSLSRGLAREAFNVASKYNSKNLNMAFAAMYSKGGAALGAEAGTVTKSAQLLAAGTAEALVFGVHTLGQHLFTNMGYNIFAEKKRLVDGSGKDLTAMGVIQGLLVSLVTGAALGPMRFTGKGKITGQEVLPKYKTWTDKALDPVTVEHAVKLGILKKDLPAFFASLKRRAFPRRYNTDNPLGQEAIIAKANMLMKMSDGQLISKLPKGLLAADLARLPGKAATSEKSLKEIAKLSVTFLKNVEKSYNKEVGPWLLSEVGKDIWDSLGRMIRGSTIMNAEAFYHNHALTGSIWGEDPRETIAHILTGMFFTKKKHTFLGGDKTTYYDMSKYRKYVDSLELLGYDTVEMSKFRALLGTSGENAKKIMVSSHSGVKAMDKALSGDDGRSFLLTKDQQVAKDADAAQKGEVQYLFSSYVANDKELNKEERGVLNHIYDTVETGLSVRLHYGNKVGLISKKEYNTIKKNLLSKDMVINGNKLTAENAGELVLHALDESTNNVTKIYRDIIIDFNQDIANILNIRRDAKNIDVISMDEGVKAILENMKTYKSGSPSDNRRIQETGALVLEAVNLAKAYGLVKFTPKTKGLVTDIDSEKSEQIESGLATALEALHNLQFGNARTGEWRSESFGGVLKDKDNKKYMLQDRFADVHMLSAPPLYEGVHTGMLWARNLIGEKIFSMDIMLETDMKMHPADRDVLGEINKKIKDVFKDGPKFIVEDGIKSTSPLNKVLERMYRAHELEHPNRSKTEEEFTAKEAKEFVDEVERHVGDLFKSEESFEPFMRYLEATSIDRIYAGNTRFNYGAKAALVELINSGLNVVKGVTIYLPTQGAVKKGILSHAKLEQKKKIELIDFYNEWYNESENSGRLQKSEVDMEFKDLDMLIDVIGKMELVYNRQKWTDHIKEIDKFRMSMLGVNKQLEVLDAEVRKALDEAKRAFDQGVKDGVQLDTTDADFQAFETKKDLVSSLRDQQIGLFATYEKALRDKDWVVLNSLLGSNVTKTIEELKKDLLVDNADLSAISEKYLKKRGRIILNAIQERNKIFSKTGMEYNKVVDSKASGIEEFTGVTHDDAIINWNKFAQKYGLSNETMDSWFSLHRNTFKILEEFILNRRPEMKPVLDFLGSEFKAMPEKSSFVVEELYNLQPDFLEIFGEYITGNVLLSNHKYNQLASTKKATPRSEISSTIMNEVMTLMRAELKVKKIGTMSWENGKLIEDVGNYAHSDKGFSGMFDRLGLAETNSVYIFTEKSVNGRIMSLLTPDLIVYMNQQMAKGNVPIENFADQKQSVDKDTADNISNSVHIGFGEGANPQPFIMTLDGKTNLIVNITETLNNNLRRFLGKKSSLRNELETILKDSQGKVSSKRAKAYLSRLNNNLEILKTPQEGQPVDGIIREMFYLSRLIIDAPTKLRNMILTGEGIIGEEKLYKYVGTLSPNGTPVNKATLLGARSHASIMKRQFKKGTLEFKQYENIEERMNNATGTTANPRDARIVTILDEAAAEHTPDGSKDFFDVHNQAKAHAENENHRIFQDESGNFSESKFDEIHQELKKATKSNVDGEMLVSLDVMASLLFARGEGLDAFRFNKEGKIIGFHHGAIKPNIWHSKVDVKTGEIALFTGKTAIKYRPRFDHFFKNKNVDAIMFESANKFNEFVPSFGAKEESRNTQLSLNALLSDNTNRKMYRENNWEKLVLKGLNNYGDFTNDIAEIPYSSFLLRSTAREHDAVLSRATFTFLDETSLGHLSDWIGQKHNLTVAQNMLSLARDFKGLDKVARFLNDKKEPGAISNELVDSLVDGGHAIPMSLQGTINQQIMSALNRAGNFTSVAREGAYSVMTAGNHLSYAIKKDGEVIKFGGSGISHYAADKEVYFLGQVGGKKEDATPSIIATVGGEDFIIGKDLSGIEILNRGRTVKEKDIELGTLVLRELGLDQYLGNQMVGGYELYTQGHKKAVALIVKEILAGTYQDMQDLKMNVNETAKVTDIIAWLDGVKLSKFKHNQDVRIKNGVKSQSDIRNTILKEKLTSVIEDIIKHREKLIKKASTQEQKKSLRDADNWAELKERIGRDGVLKSWKDKTTGAMKNRILEGMWLTKTDLRIPKDSIEGMLLTKIEKIISKSRGAVSEMNGADAILIQDADFDLDKSVEWWGMPWSMTKNINQVSGYVKYPSISTKSEWFGQTSRISMLSDVDNILRQRMGQDKEFKKVRAGIISSHHLISFLANLSLKSEGDAVMKTVGLKSGEGEGFIKPKHGFGTPSGKEVKELTLGEWVGEDNLKYRINLAASSDFINATHSMKEWLKLVMDVDNATRPKLSTMSQEAILDHIFFNGEAGFFQLTRQNKNDTITRVEKWSGVGEGLRAREHIKKVLLSPMRQLFSLMGGDVMMEGGVRRDVLPYDYAEVLGRVRKDLFRVRDEGKIGALGRFEGFDFSKAASYALNSLADSHHPYLKTLRTFSDFSSKDWLQGRNHPLEDLIFVKEQEKLFGEYEKLQRAAARYVNNQKLALHLNAIDWAINSIHQSMNYFSSQVKGDAKDPNNLDVHAKEWQRYKKDLDAKIRLRETLSYALTYDISAQEMGKKISRASQIWGFLKKEGQGPSQVTVDSDKYKVPVLIYRASPNDIEKSRFEMVKPGETSRMFVKSSDAVLINPRRYEYVQDAEQQGLQAMFRAFANRVNGVNVFHQESMREIADNMVKDIKSTYFDSHGGVDFKVKSATDWQRYQVKILETINNQFKKIEDTLKGDPAMIEKLQEQLIYEILRPDLDTNAFAVSHTVDSNNQIGRRYTGHKYFNNHTGQKAILTWLNNIANGSRNFRTGNSAVKTNSTVMTPERAKELFHKVMDLYTQHSRKVYDSFLPSDVANVSYPETWKGKRETGFLPKHEAPDWVLQGKLSKSAEASIFADYLLGLHVLPPNVLYDLSTKIALQLATSAKKQETWVKEMSKAGTLGQLITDVWRKESVTLNQYGKKVAPDSFEGIVSYFRKLKSHRGIMGREQGNKLTKDSITDKFNCLKTGK